MSPTSTMPTGTSSAGVRSGYDRTLALNAFTRTSLDPTVALEWVRKPAVIETWRALLIVDDAPLRADLWEYLADDALWALLEERTEPLSDYDSDSLSLPGTAEVLLAQYEPRDPEGIETVGELHRVAVFYDERTASWQAWQWSVPTGTGGAAILAGVLKRNADGRWYADESGPPDGYLVQNADGRPMGDTSAVAADYHLRVVAGSRARAYL